jgi:hypothetical protein
MFPDVQNTNTYNQNYILLPSSSRYLGGLDPFSVGKTGNHILRDRAIRNNSSDFINQSHVFLTRMQAFLSKYGYYLIVLVK